MKSRRNEEIGILGAGCWNAIILEIRFGTLCTKEMSGIRGLGIYRSEAHMRKVRS